MDTEVKGKIFKLHMLNNGLNGLNNLFLFTLCKPIIYRNHTDIPGSIDFTKNSSVITCIITHTHTC